MHFLPAAIPVLNYWGTMATLIETCELNFFDLMAHLTGTLATIVKC